MSSRSPVHGHPSDLAQVVERNIQALLHRKQVQDRAKRIPERIADAVTKFAGSMTFVFIHLVAYGLWIVVNLGWIPGIEPFDPTFVVLAMEASVEAIFLSTFVLISQNRMAAAADERANLDLQVSLLSEHEVTRLVSLVTQIAQRMGIEDAHDPELDELAKDVAPEKVMDRMEEHERALGVNRGAG